MKAARREFPSAPHSVTETEGFQGILLAVKVSGGRWGGKGASEAQGIM